jgi:hypothetical protein
VKPRRKAARRSGSSGSRRGARRTRG